MTNNKYFAEKMRLYRKRNPFSQKQFVYTIKIGDNEYAFLRKSDIVIERKHINNLRKDTNIIKTF